MARVNVNVSKNTLKIVIAVGAVILAALLAGIIVHIVNYISYETADAKVINVYSETHTKHSGGKTVRSSSHYAVLGYTVDGKDYTTEMQLLFSGQLSEGSTMTVRYDPANPNETEDTFFLYVMMIFSVLFIIVEIMLINSLKYAEDSPNDQFEKYKKKKITDREKLRQLSEREETKP